MPRSLQSPFLYRFMTYKTNPMLWYARKTALNQSLKTVCKNMKWCQGHFVSLQKASMWWEETHENKSVAQRSDGRKRLTDIERKSLRSALCCVPWSHASHREQDKERQSPKHQASMDSFNEWREKLHRWSLEERLTCRKAGRQPLGRAWVRGGQNTSVTEVVFF